MDKKDARQFVRVDRIIDIEYTTEGQSFTARVTDISEGGVFVDTTYPQPIGSRLRFSFHLPDDPEPIAGKAVVVWQQPMLGMGIHFEEIPDEARERLRFFVGSVFFRFSVDPAQKDD